VSRRLVEIAGVLFVFGTLTAALTWPQATHLRTHVPSFDDSLLSIWRIAWIAHAIGSPASLADANIFHPEARTLAYTDAVLLQGLVATPFIRAGASPVLVYNLLILGSIALSGAAMYLLARRLTGSWSAAFVAGTIFAFVTYRFDHVMHLELQATVFMPLALWFLDRAFEDGRRRDMAGFGVCLVLQLLSGIYYTVFLVTALAVAIPLRWLRLTPERRRAFARQLVIVAAIAAICALPYLSLYLQNRTTVGERTDADVWLYSATPINYLSSYPANLAHGHWGGPLGRSERRLFPGIAAIGLGLMGLWGWSARKTTIAVLGIVGLILSLGLNTPIYGWVRELVFTYRGLRAPARAGILVMLAVSLFAAYGWAAILARHPRWKLVGTGLVMAVLTVEYVTIPGELLPLPNRPSALAHWLSQQPRSVVVELPLPRADALHTIQDGLYMYASTFHWQPILNGYSGFYPRSYLELIDEARDFPAGHVIAYLKQRRVDLIVLHGRFLKPDEFGRWAAALAARGDIEQVAQFPELGGGDLVFRLRR
jgi:Dolichyl-phosphate-mannose-protein mannosyltransferase